MDGGRTGAAGRPPAAWRNSSSSTSSGVEEKVLAVATGEFDANLKPKDYAVMKPAEQANYRVVAIAQGCAGQGRVVR